MKTLWLLRHAKSSWSQPELADHERPLKPRGRRAAKKIARVLIEQSPFPETIVSSSAIRACETWQIIAAEWSRSGVVPPVVFRDDLYHASVEQLRRITSELCDDFTAVLLIGHNPGFEDFVSAISSVKVTIPTAGLLRIELNSRRWSEFATTHEAHVSQIWLPRELE